MKKQPLGQILLKTHSIAERQLSQALEEQKHSGGRLGDVLTTNGSICRIDLYRALAEQSQMSYFPFSIEAFEERFDSSLLSKIHHSELIKYQAAPAQRKGEVLTLLTAEPNCEETLQFYRERFQVACIQQVVVTDLDIVTLAKEYFQEAIMDQAVYGFHRKKPQFSSLHVLSKGQFWAFAAVIVFSFLGVYWNARLFCLSAFFLIQLFYIASIAFRGLLCWKGSHSAWSEGRKGEGSGVPRKDLPIYTLLIPVYREPEVIPSLIQALKNLDYPSAKLDVLLLLEDRDVETIEAAKAAQPPANWRFILLPQAYPQTKPKACNYGLQFARGEYVVIFDAEDLPDTDQLLKAIEGNRRLGERGLCVQAALNYYNSDENWITGWFTLEYCYQYDYLLPGLEAFRLPIPLGGTSNHFHTKRLREIGAWDPFNTTEDAELGMRAYIHGLRVGLIDSTTYEEANNQYWNWVRQRSRWLKGHMQTALVYSRNPLKSIQRMGLRKWCAAQLLLAGTSLTLLSNPFVWGACLALFFAPERWIHSLDIPPALLYVGVFNLAVTNFLGIYFNMLGVFKRRYFRLLTLALLNPLYWLTCHSVAAYKALWQLFFRPHYWEKTNHGLSHYRTPPQ